MNLSGNTNQSMLKRKPKLRPDSFQVLDPNILNDFKPVRALEMQTDRVEDQAARYEETFGEPERLIELKNQVQQNVINRSKSTECTLPTRIRQFKTI